MNKYMYCPQCGEEREVEIREERESYPVKNEQTEILAHVTYCKHCGEQIWNEELDEENLQRAYRQYRTAHKLLQPEDIKRIRTKYDLTQTTFAKILGFGDKTITRYEAGNIQDNAQNNLIELANYPDVFELLLKKSKDLIPAADYERAIKAVEKLRPTVIINEDKNSPFSYNTNQTNSKYKFDGRYFGGLDNAC